MKIRFPPGTGALLLGVVLLASTAIACGAPPASPPAVEAPPQSAAPTLKADSDRLVSPEWLAGKTADANVVTIDLRAKPKYEAGHIPGAETVVQATVQLFVETADHSRPLIVCCYHGNMSQGAADYFNQNGFADTYSLDGGYEAWQAASGGE